MIALDASALLAFLFRENGHEQVSGRLADACMSAVNLSEVLGRFFRDGHDGREAQRRILGLGLEIVSFTQESAAACAALVPATRSLGLSLGDRACLSLAADRGIPALTADKAWKRLRLPVEIQVIR